ncbi:MAG: transglycosylase SLT domain-containing protein [Myxococcaceae bacterium]
MIRLRYAQNDEGERSADFEGFVVRFGSDAECELRLPSSPEAPIQHSHGQFVSVGDGYIVIGKNARCPLWVNGRQVQRATLHGGERIRVGSAAGPEIRVEAIDTQLKSRALQRPLLTPSAVQPPEQLSSAPLPVGLPTPKSAPVPQPIAAPPVPPKAPHKPSGSAVAPWIADAQEKIREARSSNDGKSSGQTMMFVAEALSAFRQNAERRISTRQQALIYGGIGALVIVSTLVAVILFQHQQISRLVREKTEIDAQIRALSEAMAGETDEMRLSDMERRLQTLTGTAEQKVTEVRRSNPKRGEELAAPPDELERDFRKLLKSFNAETYVIPPNFKTTLQAMVAELVASPALRSNDARRRRHWPEISAALAKSELPVELGYIAFTESRFDPQAHNARSGAAGMWQLMPATARACHITVSPSVDQRYVPAKASMAAACYLSKLLIEFGQESFMLALASYNRGENGVRSALHRVAKEPGGYKKRDFWHLYRLKLLPEETRDYVPRVLAAALVFEHPEKYGLSSATP